MSRCCSSLASVQEAARPNYPSASWETIFTQTGHGVSGTAAILDDRTIRLTHFSYDAPDMYVYLATNLTSAPGWRVPLT